MMYMILLGHARLLQSLEMPFSQHNVGKQPVTEDFLARFSLGDMYIVCPFCHSLSFKNFNCCQNGKVVYDPPTDFPTELQALNLQIYQRLKTSVNTFANTITITYLPFQHQNDSC